MPEESGSRATFPHDRYTALVQSPRKRGPMRAIRNAEILVDFDGAVLPQEASLLHGKQERVIHVQTNAHIVVNQLPYPIMQVIQIDLFPRARRWVRGATMPAASQRCFQHNIKAVERRRGVLRTEPCLPRATGTHAGRHTAKRDNACESGWGWG